MKPKVVHPNLSTRYLQIRDLMVSFPAAGGRYVAVRDINLIIERGQIVSLIGHSGCGKSTILNAIGGLVKPTQGEVILAGRRVDGPGPDRGIVFQHYSLLPWLSVYQNIFEAVDSVRTDIGKSEKAALVES